MLKKICAGFFVATCTMVAASAASEGGLSLSPNDTLEMQGLSVIVYQNPFHPVFFDEKNAAIQLILHGDRIATDGEVRLSPTPEQWDPIPTFVHRVRGPRPSQLVVTSQYKSIHLKYRIVVTAEGQGFRIAVNLDKPLPKELAGKAGFNLDFLPTAYFGKTYLMDKAPGLFPRHPNGPMVKDGSGDPLPLAAGGKTITLSPEDPLTRVSITSDCGPLALYDARNRAQNGWFVVRSLIPAGAKDNAVVWHVRPNVVKGWVRQPVVSFNQAGYTPGRAKVALIELDPHFKAPVEAALVKLTADGGRQPVFRARIKPWGKWTRYDYASFDFSAVREPGIYAISYAGRTTNPFRISADAYARIWQASLDTYLPAQMDHVKVREQYRIWNGASHLDDARQAPPNIKHFDGYKMGAKLDSPYKPGEHIPGLDVGGWQDAGDYDIQTPSQGQVILDLVTAQELFGLDWDETTVDAAARSVEIRRPDGVPDVLQQIKHGTMQLLAQYKAFGHTIVGIIDPTLRQYTHLGDAASQTDNLLYDPGLGPNQRVGDRSGIPDDRWAFTTNVPAVEYSSIGALAAASRVLGKIDPVMAGEALATARTMWDNERKVADRPAERAEDDWWGGMQEVAETAAAIQLVIATRGEGAYAARLKELVSKVDPRRFAFIAGQAALAIPYMDAAYREQVEAMVKKAMPELEKALAVTPFGVPVSLHSWAGSGQVAMFGANMYILHKAFPQIVGTKYTLDALDYILGRHPATNLSLVPTVGTESKLIMYGHNRADYSFIPGALVPGVLVIKPDFPEQKVDWPFLWFENESTVGSASAYILAANAAIAAAEETP